jgi:hypothetical protein
MLVFVAFVCFQFAFIATPDAALLSRDYHVMRGGLSTDCWLPHRFAEMVVFREDPNALDFAGEWRITNRGPLLGLLFAAEWTLCANVRETAHPQEFTVEGDQGRNDGTHGCSAAVRGDRGDREGEAPVVHG